MPKSKAFAVRVCPLWVRTPTVVVRYRLSLFFEKEPVKDQFIATEPHREPWNKGKLVGEKTPQVKDIWGRVNRGALNAEGRRFGTSFVLGPGSRFSLKGSA